MGNLDLQSRPLGTSRHFFDDVAAISVFQPASAAVRRLSLSAQSSVKARKTVTFNLASRLRPSTPQRSLLYHLHTGYLFVAKDVKTILVPQTMFGLLNAYHLLQKVDAISSTSTKGLLSRTPLVVLWILLNLLPFCIDNQSQPGAIAEDRANKPSRPLPAERLTAKEARTWMFILYGAAFITSLCIGGTSMCVALMGLGWLYNDCQMSEKGWIERNALTALGYAAFGIGALTVAMAGANTNASVDFQMWLWVGILAAVIGTTGHMTDLADLDGDKLRGRKTAPIVLGEDLAILTIIVPIAVWSLLCPWFWNTSFLGSVVPAMLGTKMITRLLTKRTAAEYKQTFRMWNLWVAVLYCLPLLSRKS